MSILDVKDFGALGDGTTDDRAAIQRALDAAKSTGVTLHFPKPSVAYKLSKYIDLNGMKNLHITGDSATILHPSDDTGVTIDAIATSVSMARSAFLIRNSIDVTIEGITFVGGNNPSITVNAGSGVYARNCNGLTMERCRQRGGFSLLQQDNQFDTTGTGDSLTVSAGIVTLVDAAAMFAEECVGQRITISGTTNIVNSGEFVIAGYTSATTITFAAANAITETSSFLWSLADGDRNTTLLNCRSDGVRGYISCVNDSKYVGCDFEWPANADVCGIGGSFAVSGTTVTFTAQAPRFLPAHQDKYIKFAGTTSAGNVGAFKLTYVSSTVVTFTNSAVSPPPVSETLPITGTWWVLNGEKAGVGAGPTAIVQGAGTQNVKSAAAMFGSDDVGKNLRINGASNANNNKQGVISAYVSSTEVTIVSAAGTNETFSGVITVDGYDTGTNGTTYGSSHGFYIFGSSSAAHGRQNILIDGCTFRGNRTCCIKVSGTSAPIRGVRVVNCSAYECGPFFIGGADDANEHTGMVVHNNVLVDCNTQRAGFDSGGIIVIMGSRGTRITDNLFHFTRNGIGSVNGIGVGNPSGISASRFVTGISQPIDDLTIARNKFTADPSQCDGANIFGAYTISVNGVGLKAKYRTGGTLTKHGIPFTAANATEIFTAAGHGFATGDGPVRVSNSGGALPTGLSAGTDYWVIKISSSTFYLATSAANANAGTNLTISNDGTGTHTLTTNIMTLTDSSAKFSTEELGKTVTFVNSTTSANDGSYTILTCTATAFTFYNTAGVAEAFSGTYRIFPRNYRRGGSCIIKDNEIYGVGSVGISTTSCVAPEIIGNTFQGLLGNIHCNGGDLAPRVVGNREIGAATTGARVRFSAGTAWPYYDNNLIASGAMGLSNTRDMGVAVSGSTAVDFPLLGKTGRCRPSDGKEEVVVAYGANPVDGDTIFVTSTTYTYKASGPTGNQFNSFSGLVGLIDALSGHDCDDYGTSFSAGAVTTQHLRIRRSTATASSDGTLDVICTSLNPTFLVGPRNGSTTSHTAGRGSGSAGPVADKTVVWSNACTWTGAVTLVPDNDSARTLLSFGTAASGLITCATKANLVDTDYMTIGDGINVAKVYEFDTAGNGVTTGRVQVNVSTDTTAAQVAARLRTAILANQPALSVTDNADGTLTVTHNWPGTGGNVTMTENVTHASFTVAGLSGGTVGGYKHLKAEQDAGSCDLLQHGKSVGTEEWRWAL